MKRQICLVLLAGLLSQTGLLAQIPRSSARPVRLPALSGEERARLLSAHLAALRDPALRESRERFQQARREYRDKLQDALIKADPAVRPIIEKVRRQRHEEH